MEAHGTRIWNLSAQVVTSGILKGPCLSQDHV